MSWECPLHGPCERPFVHCCSTLTIPRALDVLPHPDLAITHRGGHHHAGRGESYVAALGLYHMLFRHLPLLLVGSTNGAAGRMSATCLRAVNGVTLVVDDGMRLLHPSLWTPTSVAKHPSFPLLHVIPGQQRALRQPVEVDVTITEFSLERARTCFHTCMRQDHLLCHFFALWVFLQLQDPH